MCLLHTKLPSSRTGLTSPLLCFCNRCTERKSLHQFKCTRCKLLLFVRFVLNWKHELDHQTSRIKLTSLLSLNSFFSKNAMYNFAIYYLSYLVIAPDLNTFLYARWIRIECMAACIRIECAADVKNTFHGYEMD